MQHFVWVPNLNYNDINPCLFGYETCQSNQSYGPGKREHYMIYYIVSGKGIFQIKNKKYTLSKGDFFVMKPNEEVYFCADKNDPWTYIWIGFSTKTELPVSLPHTANCPKALNIFNTMKKCRKLKSGRSAFLTARLWDFFALLMDDENNYIRYIDEALDYMNANFMHNISISHLADRLGLERTYFSTLFRKKTGFAPKQYLLHYRMEVAVNMMHDDKNSLTEIAKSVGYPDLFSFSKSFKTFIGYSPTQFLKLKEEEQFSVAKNARLKWEK